MKMRTILAAAVMAGMAGRVVMGADTLPATVPATGALPMTVRVDPLNTKMLQQFSDEEIDKLFWDPAQAQMVKDMKKSLEGTLRQGALRPLWDPQSALVPDLVLTAVAGATEKAAFLGVTTSPAGATVREQLKLAKGTGLVVEFVEKDSPAGAAGIAVHDVLTKLDDQVLVNMPQLAVLVRMHKPGDTVKLTYIRGGESKTAEVKLVEKEVPVLEDTPAVRQLQIPLPGGGMQGNLLLPRIDVNGGPAWQPAGRISVKTENGVTTKTMVDADQTLVLMIDKDGKKTLRIESKKVGPDGAKNNEIVFSGPVDTDEQKKGLPAGAAEKLKQLESNNRMGGLQLQIGGAGGGGGVQIVGNAGGGHSTMSMTRADGEHTLTLKVVDGDQTLTVKDHDGKVLFDGPINTEEERKKIPDDIAAKLERMQVKVGR